MRTSCRQCEAWDGSYSPGRCRARSPQKVEPDQWDDQDDRKGFPQIDAHGGWCCDSPGPMPTCGTPIRRRPDSTWLDRMIFALLLAMLAGILWVRLAAGAK